jgi:site-specific DNA-methyltransferase (adenine-specific)
MRLRPTLLRDIPTSRLAELVTGTIHGDYRHWVGVLPLAHVDLLFLDPPYNLDKAFNGNKSNRKTQEGCNLGRRKSNGQGETGHSA